MADRNVDLKNMLKDKGLKLTTQRQAVLDVIVQHEGRHLNTEEIYEIVRIKNPEIGLATVYRTVMLLEQMRLLHKLDLDDGVSRYEFNRDKDDHKHHHLICNVCGEILEVEEDLLESLEAEIKRKKGFIVHDHRVKFYGICAKCADKNMKI